MSAAGLIIDTRQFQSALRDYVAVTGKDMDQAANRQLTNWMIKSSKVARQAERAQIEAVKNQPWWPKLIAKVMSAKGLRAWRVTKRGRIRSTGEEKRVSDRLIRSRLRAITFIKAFFRAGMKSMSRYSGSSAVPAGRFSDMRVVFRPSAAAQPASLSVSYDYRKRGLSTAREAEHILQDALTSGLSDTVKDMRAYIERKLADRARERSARS